jgi:hypothetical protein
MKKTQLSSKIQNITELSDILCDENTADSTLTGIFSKFNIKRINTFFDDLKTKGIPPFNIIFTLFLTRILETTVRGLLKSDYIGKGELEKDSVYRLKNDSRVDWRRFLYYIVTRYLYLVKKNSIEPESAERCFILDDSLLHKTGKKIEFIGKVFDHVLKRSVLGFKILTLGLWDGKSFNPIDFSLHREHGNNKRKPYGLSKKDLKCRYSKKRPNDSAATNRIKELDATKIITAVQMVKRAVKRNITAHYVLSDSWFTSVEFVKEIRKIRNGILHILGMCKIDRRKYLHNGKELTAKELLSKYAKKMKRCRKIRSQYISLNAEYKDIELQLFFTRQNKSSKWKLLITTDLNLAYIKATEIYQIRWSIEVFFKEGKQYLQLGKSQSNDFDAQIADITITIIVYIMLNLRKRFSDYETLGELFRAENKYYRELTLREKLWGLFIEIMLLFVEIFKIDIEEVQYEIISQSAAGKKLMFILESMREFRLSKVAE